MQLTAAQQGTELDRPKQMLLILLLVQQSSHCP
jgi:hypothetical protein